MIIQQGFHQDSGLALMDICRIGKTRSGNWNQEKSRLRSVDNGVDLLAEAFISFRVGLRPKTSQTSLLEPGSRLAQQSPNCLVEQFSNGFPFCRGPSFQCTVRSLVKIPNRSVHCVQSNAMVLCITRFLLSETDSTAMLPQAELTR